ncbi:MAG: multidrug effflux MFS transporter [Polyangiales bacterium]
MASGGRGLVVLLGGITAIAPLSIDAYLPSLPTIERELGAARGQAELTLSAYFLGLAIAQLVWGPVADRHGRRRPLAWGLGLYVLGSIACSLAPSLPALVAARFLQAVGGAAGIVVTRAVVRDVWSGRDAANVLSQIVLVMGAAPIFAPLLGGAVLEVASWRAIFVGLAIAGALALLATLRLPETRTPRPKERFVTGLRGALGDRAFLTFTFAGGFAQAGMFAYIAGSPFVFIQWLGLSPSSYAIFFGSNAAGYVAFSQLNRVALRHWDPTTIAKTAGLVMVGAASVLLAVVSFAPSVWAVAVPLFTFVASLGLVASNTVASALESQGARAGLASALLGTAQFTTSSLVSACVGLVAALEVADGSAGTGRPMASVMLAAGSICVVLVLLGRRAMRHAPRAV